MRRLFHILLLTFAVSSLYAQSEETNRILSYLLPRLQQSLHLQDRRLQRDPSYGRLPSHHLVATWYHYRWTRQSQSGVLQQFDLRGNVYQRGGNDRRREGVGEWVIILLAYSFKISLLFISNKLGCPENFYSLDFNFQTLDFNFESFKIFFATFKIFWIRRENGSGRRSNIQLEDTGTGTCSNKKS